MVNLLPPLSLKMHSYPECIWEVSARYKSTTAESRMRSRQWELQHCSIVYTVPLLVSRRVCFAVNEVDIVVNVVYSPVAENFNCVEPGNKCYKSLLCISLLYLYVGYPYW